MTAEAAQRPSSLFNFGGNPDGNGFGFGLSQPNTGMGYGLLGDLSALRGSQRFSS
jgi:hypothetical protein